MGATQKEGGESSNETAGDDNGFPNQTDGKDQRSGCSERNKQGDEGGFANADATLRDGQNGGEFGERPGKQPDTQRKYEAAGDG
ncbi:MAG: hypothetical protein PVS2B2_06760 [Candidatus Acidiferrum sp.]